MHPKVQFRILAWVTLLVFPAIGWALLYFFGGYTFEQLVATLELDNITNSINLIGLELGLAYGMLVIAISQAPIFEELSTPQVNLLKNLKLTWFDVLFISFAAGFGEEILFRVGLQTWFGPWLTSILFIAVHGYFSLSSFKKNILGLLLLPFIVIISYAYEELGLWFSISAHFSYDLLMFAGVMTYRK